MQPVIIGLGPILLVAWRTVKGPSRLPLIGELPGGLLLTIGPLPQPDLSDPIIYLVTGGKPVDVALARRLYSDRPAWFLKQTDGKVALMPLEEFTGRDSLQAVARKRDLPPR